MPLTDKLTRMEIAQKTELRLFIPSNAHWESGPPHWTRDRQPTILLQSACARLMGWGEHQDAAPSRITTPNGARGKATATQARCKVQLHLTEASETLNLVSFCDRGGEPHIGSYPSRSQSWGGPRGGRA